MDAIIDKNDNYSQQDLQVLTNLPEFFGPIGERLLLVRLENGLSQTNMAKELGVSMRAYHSYEKGERGMPIEAVRNFSFKFGKSSDWLLFGKNAARQTGNVEANFEEFGNQLDSFIATENIAISSENLNKVRAMWLDARDNEKPTPFEICMAWVDALKR